MEKKSINQKQGPRTGNAGNSEKRAAFMSEKSSTNSERSAVAKMVIGALETRGKDNRSFRSPGVEPLHANTNVGRGPTKGNAGKRGK